MKTRIHHVLTTISLLLSENGEKTWADIFSLFNQQLESDYDTTLREIKNVFGGAGSFNDLVLHHYGQPLMHENIELNALQDQLYDALTKEILIRRSYK